MAITEGEPHIVREDLGAPPPAPRLGTGRPLLTLVQVTDLQLADVQSPTRFEFLNRYFADPRYAEIVPVQRLQEAITPHAIDATLRTINAVRCPVTGAAPQLAVTTGDAIDNAQWNEMQAFLALFDGGLVRPGSGRPGYVGVQSLDWPDDFFWKPDGAGADGDDIFRREFGFPHYPGLLQRAARVLSHRAPPSLAILLRQSRGPQPGRRGDYAGPGQSARRRRCGCPQTSTMIMRWSCSPSGPRPSLRARIRLVEIIDAGGCLSIVCTMVDHDTPVAPRSLQTSDDLASLHRELAANMPVIGANSYRSGLAADRNAQLQVVPPFPLERARSW